MFDRVIEDLRAKARWNYARDGSAEILKVLLTDGTLSMLLYRSMQWARERHLSLLELVCNRLNAVLCNCIIGRGAEFGPRFVLIHSTGIVINGSVRGGSNIHLDHQVTIGAEGRASPVLGSDVFVGAGAKILGAVTVADGARVGANAVVVHDVPLGATVVGVPARIVRSRASVESLVPKKTMSSSGSDDAGDHG